MCDASTSSSSMTAWCSLLGCMAGRHARLGRLQRDIAVKSDVKSSVSRVRASHATWRCLLGCLDGWCAGLWRCQGHIAVKVDVETCVCYSSGALRVNTEHISGCLWSQNREPHMPALACRRSMPGWQGMQPHACEPAAAEG